MDGVGSFSQKDELRGELIGTFKEKFILLFKCGIGQYEVLPIQLMFTVDTQFHGLAHLNYLLNDQRNE